MKNEDDRHDVTSFFLKLNKKDERHVTTLLDPTEAQATLLPSPGVACLPYAFCVMLLMPTPPLIVGKFATEMACTQAVWERWSSRSNEEMAERPGDSSF